MRPVVRSGSVLLSVGEDGLGLSIGVRPGPLLESSGRRLLMVVLRRPTIYEVQPAVHPAKAVVIETIVRRGNPKQTY
jgi:hypothetical protein